jgi:hypothetical protein
MQLHSIEEQKTKMGRGRGSRFASWVLGAIALHAIVLFIAIPVVTSRLHHVYGGQPFADGYDQLADNLVSGHGYRFYPDTAPTMMREPGYPFLLAGLIVLFGKSLVVVRAANLALALGTAYAIFRIAVIVSPRGANTSQWILLGAPLLFLFHPGVLIAETRGGVEILFGFLLALLVLTICQAIQTDRTRDFIVAGGVLGVTVLVRSTPMLFPALLLMYLLWTDRGKGRVLTHCRNIAIMIAVMIVVLSPWVVRNYRLTGRFVPTASVLGVSAQAGQYIGEREFGGKSFLILDREASRERDRVAFSLGYPFEDGQQGYYQTFYKSMDELRFSDFLFKRVVSEYRASPLLFVRCVGQNVLNFWFAGKTWTTTVLNMIVQIPYIAFAIVGSFGLLKGSQARTGGLLVLLIAYVIAVHIPILAQARYSIPLIPIVAILAAKGLAVVRSKDRTAGRVSVAG